jgi:hypothetical protein
MKDDPWQYATYEGVERLQCQQTGKMTISQRLEALDGMIRLATSFKDVPMAVHEDSAKYGDKTE